MLTGVARTTTPMRRRRGLQSPGPALRARSPCVQNLGLVLEGKYEILEKLREGGMGAIYKVRHRLLDEVCVIKMMRPQLVEDEELRTRFLREARLAIKLRHANIAQLYDFTIDEDGTAFIVMEFISGMTFED